MLQSLRERRTAKPELVALGLQDAGLSDLLGNLTGEQLLLLSAFDTD